MAAAHARLVAFAENPRSKNSVKNYMSSEISNSIDFTTGYMKRVARVPA
jgi:hypothetical protein